jgi:hypothetical protein
MDEIKLSSMFEHFRDVKVFGYFRIGGPIFFVALVDHRM